MNIPNQLSLLRILLIPVFAVLYLCGGKQPYYLLSAVVLLLSGLTDVLDGYIARRFHMTSELGKILDPLADKLTQITVLICLVVLHPRLLWAVAVIFMKELTMLIGGLIILKKKIPMASSKWFGKVGTVMFYIATFIIIAFSDTISDNTITGIVVGVMVYMLFTLAMYIPEFFKLKNNSKQS